MGGLAWKIAGLLLVCLVSVSQLAIFRGFLASQGEAISSLPLIQDFYVNTTWAGNSVQFAFKVSDDVGLAGAVFGCNVTTDFINDTTLNLGGTQAWANFTHTLPNYNCIVSFQLWVANTHNNVTTTDMRYLKVYTYNSAAGAWNTPFNCLGDAISTVENANSWGSVETYAQVLLDQANQSSLQTMIDTYASAPIAGGRFVYGTSASGTNWANPSYSYDNDTATGASINWTGLHTWCDYLIINLTTTARGNVIRYFVGRDDSNLTTQMSIDISNRTGSWYNVFSSTLVTWGTNANVSIPFSQYTTMRYRFYSASSNSVSAFINETQAVYTYTCDALDTIKWCAFTEKLNMTWANKQNDIIWALGNATMIGNLPYTGKDSYGASSFGIESKFALYGYYYAVKYNSTGQVNMTKWNITAAYQQFDAGVNNSISSTSGLPLWIYFDSTGKTWLNRYYDEGGCTIECYLLFYSLLNVADALTKAAYWWNYINQVHWNDADQHYGYTSTGGYECEAAFFLKIISIFKYYSPNLGNWSRVLADIGTRFLPSEWNSYQWMAFPTQPSTYAVVHMYQVNVQRRLQNTLGAWQALLGCYLQLSSTYQNNIKDMLYGNSNTEPAWALLLTPDSASFPAYADSTGAGLFNASSNLFSWTSADNGYYYTQDHNATAYAEVLMFMMGIVPGTSTIAFPLEELNYEYIQDIDPVLLQLQLNATMREIRIPVVQSGTITFQYGVSPITYNFSTTGVYAVSFSPSWNMITNVTLKSSLPDNRIYFYLPPPGTPAHDVCINSVTFSEENPSVNDTVSIYVTLQNKGGNTEKFSASVNCTLINETIVGTQNMTLESEQIVTLNFTWTPTAEGLYVTKAYTSEIPGDASPEDNTQTAYLYVGTIPNGGGCCKILCMN